MEHSNKTIAETVRKIRTQTTAAEVADMIGVMERAAYLSLKADWKADYARLSKDIRQAKANMKDKDTGGSWQSPRESMRCEARRMLVVRAAIRELGHRHWAAKVALAA